MKILSLVLISIVMGSTTFAGPVNSSSDEKVLLECGVMNDPNYYPLKNSPSYLVVQKITNGKIVNYVKFLSAFKESYQILETVVISKTSIVQESNDYRLVILRDAPFEKRAILSYKNSTAYSAECKYAP